MAAIPATQGNYGAQSQTAPGASKKKPTVQGQRQAPTSAGAQTQAVTAPTPPSIPKTGQLGGDPNAQMLRSQQPAASQPSTPASPPAGYKPSVNRDGSIPDQAPVAAPQAAPASSPTPQTAGDQRPAGGTLDPNQALSQAQSAFSARFNRQMTPQEQQMLLQAVGYQAGQPVTQQMLDRALQLISQYTGNPNSPLPTGGGQQQQQTSAASWETFLRQQLETPTNLPGEDLPVYQAQTGPDFVDPTDPAARQNLLNLINEILTNPESLNPQVVAAMKEQQKENILSTNRQLMDEIGSSAASRGTFGGGNQLALQRRAADATTGELARSSRDIDIAAATTNTADRRAAAALGDQYLSSVLSRALGAHGAQMDTARFNQAERQAAHDSDVARVNFALERALAAAGLDEARRGQILNAWQVATQRDLGNRGLDLDQQRITQNASQFDRAHQLDWFRALNDAVMGRANYGLSLAQLQQMGQNSMFDWLFGR